MSRKPFVYKELERLGENEPEKRNGLHCFTFGLRRGAWKGRFRGYFFTSGFAGRLKWDDGQVDCDGATLVAFFVLLLKILFANFFHIIIIWYICTIIEIDMAKVIHVHLLCRSRYECKDYYFASISAIYTVLKPEEVGATKNYLLHAGLSGNGTVCTKKAIIKQSTLIRCPRHQDGADWRKNAVRTAFWRRCIWMLFGGVECSPFFVLDYAVFGT